MKIIKISILFFFLSLFLFGANNALARSGCCSYHSGVRADGCGCNDGTPLSSTCAPYYSCSGGGSYNTYSAPVYNPPPSCPLNSSYDSISETCKCYSGYVSNGSSCISYQQNCWNTMGYSSTYDYLSSSCKCSSGYVYSGGTCVSGSSYCWDNYGYNSQYNSLNSKCECRYGYVWNGQGNSCISQDESCHSQLGIMSRYNSLNNTCECFSGYTIQSGSCQLEEVKTYPIVPYVPKIDSITPTNTPTPTIAPKPTKRPSLIITPKPTSELTPSATSMPIDINKIEQKPTPRRGFWQWLLGLLTKIQ